MISKQKVRQTEIHTGNQKAAGAFQMLHGKGRHGIGANGDASIMFGPDKIVEPKKEFGLIHPLNGIRFAVPDWFNKD